MLEEAKLALALNTGLRGPWFRIPQDGERGLASTDKENLALAVGAAGGRKQIDGSGDMGLSSVDGGELSCMG